MPSLRLLACLLVASGFWSLPSPGAERRPNIIFLHIRYYQTISGLDHVIGGLLKDLKSRGLHDNTVILYASDHGLPPVNAFAETFT